MPTLANPPSSGVGNTVGLSELDDWIPVAAGAKFNATADNDEVASLAAAAGKTLVAWSVGFGKNGATSGGIRVELTYTDDTTETLTPLTAQTVSLIGGANAAGAWAGTSAAMDSASFTNAATKAVKKIRVLAQWSTGTLPCRGYISAYEAGT